jgi:hypothetical protein
MSDQEPSVLDLVELLIVSGGLSPETALRLSREIDTAFAISTRSGGSRSDQRERWRLKKERQRARKKALSPGDSPPEGIILTTSKTLSVKEESKTARVSPGDKGDSPPAVADGWPVDFLDQFWTAFPPFRRESKRKVGDKLARIRADGKVGWEQIIGAVKRYAATDPGQFACAPLVWLNGERWDREYGSTKGGSNEANRSGGTRQQGGSYSTLAARVRAGRRQRDAAGGESDHGLGDPERGFQFVDGDG